MSEQSNSVFVWSAAAAPPLAIGALMIAFANDLGTPSGERERANLMRSQDASVGRAIDALGDQLTEQAVASAETTYQAKIDNLASQVSSLAALVAQAQEQTATTEAALAKRLNLVAAVEAKSASVVENAEAQLATLPAASPLDVVVSAAGKSYQDTLYQSLAAEGMAWSTKPTAEEPAEVFDDGDPIYDINESDREFLADYGDYLAAECMSCHKIDWEYSGIPFIFLLEEDYFIHQMRAYQTGEKDNPAMASVARNLDDEMIQALAVFLKTQDPDQ